RSGESVYLCVLESNLPPLIRIWCHFSVVGQSSLSDLVAKDGSFRRYLASRSVEDLQSYISERKWEAVDPLPKWKSPSSVPMTAMAGLFRLSVWIRHVHMYLTEKLHIPVWGSYAIFAFATLLTGLFFGLILVLIADCLCPSKPQISNLCVIRLYFTLRRPGSRKRSSVILIYIDLFTFKCCVHFQSFQQMAPMT
uniref:Uncharacterized protein n=1 Tax=Erpetoichthys calabaricus TaxID=27687 RepID=A0A8C4SXY9_ERPCA